MALLQAFCLAIYRRNLVLPVYPGQIADTDVPAAAQRFAGRHQTENHRVGGLVDIFAVV